MSKTRQSNRQSQSARKAPVSACLQKPRSVLFHLPEIIFLTARFSANCLKVSWGQYLIDLIRDIQSPDNRPSSCSQDQDAKDRACSVGLPIDLYETIKVQAKQQSLSCGAYVSQLVSLAFSNELQKSVRELCQSIRPTATEQCSPSVPEQTDFSGEIEASEVVTTVSLEEPLVPANQELTSLATNHEPVIVESSTISEQPASETITTRPPNQPDDLDDFLFTPPSAEPELVNTNTMPICNEDQHIPEIQGRSIGDCWGLLAD